MIAEVTTAVSLQDLVLRYGLSGIVILALALTVSILARKYASLQDQRHEEMKLLANTYHEALNQNTRSLEELAHANARMTQSLDELKQSVDEMERNRRKR